MNSIKRMEKEYEELNERVETLEDFIHESDAYKKLSDTEKSLISVQLFCMSNYRDALEARIDYQRSEE